MNVIAKRMLIFVDPDVQPLPGEDKDASNLMTLVNAKRRFVLTSTQPQEIPSWVAELDSFKQAIEAGAVERC